ncbi:hypothetical protein N0V88_006563 [Collariella sp. IMI 366227]|nr:hypothetical protein N0V88_006563 [Collariella sp. IMI 366227]
MTVLQPYRHGYYLWKYLPSAAAAVIFCAMFAIATIALTWKLCKTRTWMTIPFAIGGYMEFIGYACRAAAHNQTSRLMPFIMQNNNIFLAPVFFAASIYMVLGRVIRATQGEEHSLVRPGRLTTLFVTGDVLSLAIQGSGAGLMVTGEYGKLSQALVLAGLVFQIVLFATFCAVAVRFQARMSRDPRVEWVSAGTRWEEVLYMLYAVSALMMLRSVFRVIEFILGEDGYLLGIEWPLYVFDTLPMFLVMIIFWQWFPSTVKANGSETK